jgi:hypothetical protein
MSLALPCRSTFIFYIPISSAFSYQMWHRIVDSEAAISETSFRSCELECVSKMQVSKQRMYFC